MAIAGYEGGHMDILSRVAILFSDTDEVDSCSPLNQPRNSSSSSRLTTKTEDARALHQV